MTQPGGYHIARCEQTVFIRPHGLANMKNAPTLDAFLATARDERGVSRVCVDLSSCSGMDSTFMGLLVGYADRYRETGGSLVIVNPSDHNARLLDMLGVSSVVRVLKIDPVNDLTFVRLGDQEEVGPLQRMQIVRQAHQNLVDLGEANRAKFAPFLKALEGDLMRLEDDGGGAS